MKREYMSDFTWEIYDGSIFRFPFYIIHTLWVFRRKLSLREMLGYAIKWRVFK